MDNYRMPVGHLEYSIGEGSCQGKGYSLTVVEIENSLRGQIHENHHLVNELYDLRQEMSALASTDFELSEIEATFSSFSGMEPWRIGETMAECWLENHRNCSFPWRTQADIRSLKASLPGTDLVGITLQGETVCFAFGEVKTSGSESTPPSVVYGDKGLTYQLKALYESVPQRKQLIQNLGFHVRNTDKYELYKQAVVSHISRYAYCYWGIMIRDTRPSNHDLEYSVRELSANTSPERPAEFVALYMAVAIDDWPAYCQWEERP